jgi:cellulose synthase/poly-beta-1,6-N-acetylglucosamine synthase-like glycosyltransferase
MITLVQIISFWVIFDFTYLFYRITLLLSHKKRIKNKEHPLVSILVPAYNEEICIKKTLNSCIHQTYPNFEILVINDGSTDRTLEEVKDFERKNKKYLIKKNILLKILNQTNQGKAKALNNGKDNAKGEFLITIDADSYLSAYAIEKIMGYFTSEDIGAVAGNIIAVSKNSLLGYLQKVEYELGIHFIRNSQSSFGSVIVTPGALSAYRKKAVKKFEEGTLTEDFDSSIRILERGYKIYMAGDAICYTQVPLSFSDLIKQRIRWQQGGLEVFSKHMFHNKRATVSLEWIFLFLFGFYALFSKVIALIYIPLLIIYSGYMSFVIFIIAFIIYSILIYSLLFFIVSFYSKDRKAILVTPIFITYYYTIVLYASLVAQILVFKGGNQSWEKIKRYHT